MKRNIRNFMWLKVVQAALMLTVFSMPSASRAQSCSPGTPAAPRVLLWPEGAPGAIGTAEADEPQLMICPAPKSPKPVPHAAILDISGGGYIRFSFEPQGTEAAQWLNRLGVSVFILEYRLAPRYSYPAQFDDGTRAMRWIRSHAQEFDIDPHRIGVWGESAGGHLASMLATRFDAGNATRQDPIERVSSRPDFMILEASVIEPLGSAAEASLKSLAGPAQDANSMEMLLTDKHVTAETPPTFLIHANDDNVVYPENSVRFYLALRAAGVPAEMHLYQHGGHGFGMALLDPVLGSWTQLLADWLRGLGVLNTR
jgi:acetyl esterase/lipase